MSDRCECGNFLGDAGECVWCERAELRAKLEAAEKETKHARDVAARLGLDAGGSGQRVSDTYRADQGQADKWRGEGYGDV